MLSLIYHQFYPELQDPAEVGTLLCKDEKKILVVEDCFQSLFGSVVEWLKRRARDQHRLGSKPTRAILLCPWERHFTALSPAWCSWQAVLNYSHISIKLQADSNILAPPEADRGNCLPYSASVAFLRVRRINIEIK